MSVLLLWQPAARLLGCVHARLCDHVPVLRTTLLIPLSILGLPPLIGAVLFFAIRVRAGECLMLLVVRDLLHAHLPGVDLCLRVRLSLCLTLGLPLV